MTSKPYHDFVARLPAIVETVRGDLEVRYGAAELERFEEFLQILLGNKRAQYADPRQRNGSPSRFWFPGLKAQPWHDPKDLPWVEGLEAAHETIRDEFIRLFEDRANFNTYAPYFGQPLDFEASRWESFYLYRLGKDFVENQAKHPLTTAIIKTLPISSEVMFTVLYPEGFAAPHCSDFNARLTCHMGLIVPPDCGIRVASESRTWEEGKLLVFDDTFEHEIWNHSSSIRAILLLDIWHPELTDIEIASLEYFINKVRATGVFMV